MKHLLIALLGLLALMLGLDASAAVPAAATAALTAIQTDGLSLIDLVWPVVAAILGGFILIRLFRRGANNI